MTSRFASLTEEDIEKMVEDKDSQKDTVRSGTKSILTISWSWKHFFPSEISNCSSSHCLLSSCRPIPHFIVLFSSGQRWLLVRGVAMGLCRRCVIFMSSCPRTLLPVTLLPCYPVTLLPCYLVPLLPYYPVTLLSCYPVTLLPYYLVTLLSCYSVTLLPCYLVTLLPCHLVNLLPSCNVFAKTDDGTPEHSNTTF